MNTKENNRTSVAGSVPLRGKTVLVTRPKDQAEEFARLLSDYGANVVFVPTIRIVPTESWHQFDDAVQTLEKYAGIIFTSANAVRSFFAALTDRGPQAARKELGKLTFYVVGEKTGETLASEGFNPVHPADVESGRDLAEAIALSPVDGTRFLFLRGNLAGEDLPKTLRSHGAQVDEVTVYDTVAPLEEDVKTIRRKLETETIDIVTFFSPSSVKNLIKAVPVELLSSKVIAVIGTSTEAAAKEAGLAVHVIATRPTSTDLVDAIVQYSKE